MRRHAVQRAEIFTGLGKRPFAVSDQIWLRDIRITGDRSATRASGGRPRESTIVGCDIKTPETGEENALRRFVLPCGGVARMAFAFVRRRLAALDAP